MHQDQNMGIGEKKHVN